MKGCDCMTLFNDMKHMKCTPTEQVIRDYILENYIDVMHMTTRDIAKKTYTSPTAVTRFCRKLGIDGFLKFKLQLVSESKSFQEELIVDEVLPLKPKDTAYQVITKMHKIQTQAIEETAKELDYRQIQKLTHLLMQCENIHFFGLGVNYYIAQEFRYLFERTGKKVRLRESKNERIAQVLDAKKGDVAFVLSHSGVEGEQYEIAKLLKEKGIFVVCLTGYLDSPLAKIADYHFYIKTGRRFVDMGNIIFPTSTRFILNVIFGYLFTFCYEDKKEEFELYAKLANYERDLWEE